MKYPAALPQGIKISRKNVDEFVLNFLFQAISTSAKKTIANISSQ